MALPDPEQVIRAGIPLLRQIPSRYHRSVAKIKSDVEDLLVWVGKGTSDLHCRIADFAVLWPTLILGAVHGSPTGAG